MNEPAQAITPGNAIELVAVDVGSGYTKTKTSNGTDNFPSIVAREPDDIGFPGGRVERVRFSDTSWIIGDDAHAHTQVNDQACTTSAKWPGSQAWFAALYGALARNGVTSGAVALYTGIPQARYNEMADDLYANLVGTHRFEYMGRDCEIEIVDRGKQMVIPQATAALIDAASQDLVPSDQIAAIIDVGTYTTGLSAVYGGKWLQNKASGVDIGVSHLCDRLNVYLRNDFGIFADPAMLPDYLRRRTVPYRGKRHDIGATIDELAGEVAMPIFNECDRLWGSANDYAIFIAGGGAPAFEKAIHTHFEHAAIVANSFWSVVQGLHYFGNKREQGAG